MIALLVLCTATRKLPFQMQYAECWQEGVSLWYNQDYMSAMKVWQRGLEALDVPPWPETKPLSSVDLDRLRPVAALFAFLAGCYLDAQDYTAAERCCRQGLTLLTAATPTNELTVRLVQELWHCFHEDPTVADPCTRAREFLFQWRRIRHTAHLADSIDKINSTVPDAKVTQEKQPWDYWYVSEWQRPAFMIITPTPLFSQPVCPRNQHPTWCRVLEEHFDRIRDECRALYFNRWKSWPRVGDGHHRQGAGAHDGTAVTAGDWREIVLYGAGAEASHRAAPFTCHLLERHCSDEILSLAHQGGGEVIISLLAPGTRIAPHCASTNLRWTAHLALETPRNTHERVQIRVADTWHTWQPGRVLVFDDSYEHEVINESADIRVVLLMRFWNPHLPKDHRRDALQQALEWKAKEQERRYHPPTIPMENDFV